MRRSDCRPCRRASRARLHGDTSVTCHQARCRSLRQERSLGECLFFAMMACAISIIVVSVMRPIPAIPAPAPSTVPLPLSTPVVTQTETTDHPAPPTWCWCRALDTDGRPSKKCVAGSPEEDYCICRCPVTEAQTKPPGPDNFFERVAFAFFVLLSLPFVLAAMAK